MEPTIELHWIHLDWQDNKVAALEKRARTRWFESKDAAHEFWDIIRMKSLDADEEVGENFVAAMKWYRVRVKSTHSTENILKLLNQEDFIVEKELTLEWAKYTPRKALVVVASAKEQT